MYVLVHLCCYKYNWDWVIYRRQKFISRGSENWEDQDQGASIGIREAVPCGAGLFLLCASVPHL